MPSRFLGLSAELRNNIYELVLVSSRRIDITREGYCTAPAIIRVNKQIYNETKAMSDSLYLTENSFDASSRDLDFSKAINWVRRYYKSPQVWQIIPKKSFTFYVREIHWDAIACLLPLVRLVNEIDQDNILSTLDENELSDTYDDCKGPDPTLLFQVYLRYLPYELDEAAPPENSPAGKTFQEALDEVFTFRQSDFLWRTEEDVKRKFEREVVEVWTTNWRAAKEEQYARQVLMPPG